MKPLAPRTTTITTSLSILLLVQAQIKNDINGKSVERWSFQWNRKVIVPIKNRCVTNANWWNEGNAWDRQKFARMCLGALFKREREMRKSEKNPPGRIMKPIKITAWHENVAMVYTLDTLIAHEKSSFLYNFYWIARRCTRHKHQLIQRVRRRERKRKKPRKISPLSKYVCRTIESNLRAI